MEQPTINWIRNQKFIIVAGEIPPSIRHVVEFLPTKHSLNIICCEYTVYQTEQAEYIVSTEKTGNFFDAYALNQTDKLNEATPVAGTAI
jgi:hypothetical protein